MPKRTRRSSATKQIRAVHRAMSRLDDALRQLGWTLKGESVRAVRVQARGSVRKPLELSAKRKAQLKLQGQYMGYMRQLKPKQKAEVKALKEKKGFEAAIKKAKGMIGG